MTGQMRIELIAQLLSNGIDFSQFFEGIFGVDQCQGRALANGL